MILLYDYVLTFERHENVISELLLFENLIVEHREKHVFINEILFSNGMLYLMGCGASSRTSSPAFYGEAVRGKSVGQVSRDDGFEKRTTTRPRDDRLLYRHRKDNLLKSASLHRHRYRYHAENHGKRTISVT